MRRSLPSGTGQFVWDKSVRAETGVRFSPNLYPLTKLYQDHHVLEHLPPAVLKNITVDGEIMKAPVGLHIDGMVYFNKHVADAVGVDPKSWKSLDDLWAVFDKIKAAGYIPIAQGGR